MNHRLRSLFAWVATLVASLLVGGVLIAGMGSVLFGSVYAVPAIMRGAVILAEPEIQSIGEIQPGQRAEVTFDLINLTLSPVHVNGLGANCSCISADTLPLAIPPRGRRKFHLLATPLASQAGKAFLQTAELYVSAPGPQLVIRVVGMVGEKTTQKTSGTARGKGG